MLGITQEQINLYAPTGAISYDRNRNDSFCNQRVYPVCYFYDFGRISLLLDGLNERIRTSR